MAGSVQRLWHKYSASASSWSFRKCSACYVCLKTRRTKEPLILRFQVLKTQWSQRERTSKKESQCPCPAHLTSCLQFMGTNQFCVTPSAWSMAPKNPRTTSMTSKNVSYTPLFRPPGSTKKIRVIQSKGSVFISESWSVVVQPLKESHPTPHHLSISQVRNLHVALLYHSTYFPRKIFWQK